MELAASIGSNTAKRSLDGICKRLWSSKCGDTTGTTKMTTASATSVDAADAYPEGGLKKKMMNYSNFTIESLLKEEEGKRRRTTMKRKGEEEGEGGGAPVVFKCPGIFPLPPLILPLDWEPKQHQHRGSATTTASSSKAKKDGTQRDNSANGGRENDAACKSEECCRPFCKLKKRTHFHCNFCDQGFSSKQRLLAHVQKHLSPKAQHRNRK